MKNQLIYQLRRAFTCCLSARPFLYIWLDKKIPMKTKWSRAWWSRWLPLYSLFFTLLARQTMLQVWQDVQAGSRPSLRCSPPRLLLSLSLSISLPVQPLSHSHLPPFAFTSFSTCLPQAKDQLAAFTGQMRGSQLQPRRKLTYLLA